MTSTPYDVPFRVDKENESLCVKTLTARDLKRFRKAVEEDYYFQMYYDDLPIWGFIGKIEKILKPGTFLFISVWAISVLTLFTIAINRWVGDGRDRRGSRRA